MECPDCKVSMVRHRACVLVANIPDRLYWCERGCQRTLLVYMMFEGEMTVWQDEWPMVQPFSEFIDELMERFRLQKQH